MDKKHLHHVLFPLLWIFACCDGQPPSPSMDCRCPYVQKGYEQLRPNTTIRDESTNSSRAAMQQWRELELELGLDMNKPLEEGNMGLLSAKGKAVIPYFGPGKEKYYRVVEIDNANFNSFQQYMLLMCDLYNRIYVLNECKPTPEEKKQFVREEEKLWKRFSLDQPAIHGGTPFKKQSPTSIAPPEPLPSFVQVVLLHPDKVEHPEVAVVPEAVQIVPGTFSTRVLVNAGNNYTMTIQDGENVWRAIFNASESQVPAQRFKKQ